VTTGRLIAPLLATALLAASATTAGGASDSTYAPLDRPGPALSVPRAKLAGALDCSRGVRDARRTPVLLVPGTNTTPQEFAWNYVRAFRMQHWPYCTVDLPAQATGDIQVAGEYVVYAIRRMARLADRRIDVVGHSQGGMVPRWALRFWPDTRELVDDLVGMAPSNHGTLNALVTCKAGCPVAHIQQAQGSRFLEALNSRAETFAGVSYTVAYTHYDEVVVPNLDESGSSALHTGSGAVANIATQDVCPASTADHLSAGTYDPVVYAIVMDALDHRGPAKASRISPTACTQLLSPPVAPATFPADYGETLRIIAEGFQASPSTTTEPPLRSYVFARHR
jgi:triacylglycerol esterase/lipase EstA (alpha/beta hydrolase family)